MPGAYSGHRRRRRLELFDRPLRADAAPLQPPASAQGGPLHALRGLRAGLSRQGHQHGQDGEGRQGRRLALHPLLLLSRGLPVGGHRPGVHRHGPGDAPAGADVMSGRAAETARGAAGGVVGDAARRRRIRLVALDLDGVVWRGSEVLPGAPEALAEVLRRGLDLRYVSNNSTAHRETVSERLEAWDCPPERSGCSPRASSPDGGCANGCPRGRRVVVGEAGAAARTARGRAGAASLPGKRPQDGGGPPGGRRGGHGPGFSYDTLAAAQAAILGGALFVATNRDATFPTPEGLVAGTRRHRGGGGHGRPAGAGPHGQARSGAGRGPGGGHRRAPGPDPLRGRQAEHRHRHGHAGRHGHGPGAHRGHQRGRPAARATPPRPRLPDHVLADLRDLPRLLDSLGPRSSHDPPAVRRLQSRRPLDSARP